MTWVLSVPPKVENTPPLPEMLVSSFPVHLSPLQPRVPPWVTFVDSCTFYNWNHTIFNFSFDILVLIYSCFLHTAVVSPHCLGALWHRCTTACLSLIFTALPSSLYFLVCLWERVGIWHSSPLWGRKAGFRVTRCGWRLTHTSFRCFLQKPLLTSTPDGTDFTSAGSEVQNVRKRNQFSKPLGHLRSFRNYYLQDITNTVLLLT